MWHLWPKFCGFLPKITHGKVQNYGAPKVQKGDIFYLVHTSYLAGTNYYLLHQLVTLWEQCVVLCR